ncbi:GntR family transcriptional regulator [Lacticaseibacillus jixiensis]|uniref:GntR family transcriptional regulator n=1 Tax=Lacticaseibacillus jixiensis TaxID=3231926 RepID=UPI0036F29D21
MSKTPLYYTIYQQLQSDIRSGKYPLGANLPTDHILSEQFNVSVITIKKAMELLSADGYITRKPRKGTTVTATTPLEPQPTNHSHLLFGLVTTNFTDYFGTTILRSILYAEPDKVDFIVKISYGDRQVESQAINELIAMGVQGLIILPTSSEYVSPKLIELIAKNFPVVVLDRLMGELPISSVKTNNEVAAKALTDYLIDRGHTHLGMINANSAVTTIDERITGFISAQIEHQLPFSRTQIFSQVSSVVPNSAGKLAEDVAKIKQFLLADPAITALVCSEFNVALLAQRALEQLHKVIPRDVSVVCFDSPARNEFDPHPFTFTHIEQDENEIGRTAVNLLIKKYREPKFFEKVNLSFKLIEGDTVAPNHL